MKHSRDFSIGHLYKGHDKKIKDRICFYVLYIFSVLVLVSNRIPITFLKRGVV